MTSTRAVAMSMEGRERGDPRKENSWSWSLIIRGEGVERNHLEGLMKHRLEIQWASCGAREFVFLTSCLVMLLLLVQRTHFENDWSRVSPGSGSGNGEWRGTYHSPKQGLYEIGHFTNACRIPCMNSHIKLSREDRSSHISFQWTSFGNTFFLHFLYLSK